MVYSWKFATKRNGDRGNGGEDTSLKQFRDFNNRYLIREFAQNSIDAPSNIPDSLPVEIHFSYIEINGTLKQQLINDLEEHVVACKKMCLRASHSKNPYDAKLDYIKTHLESPVFCLKISDYNTTGMDYFDEELWETEEEFMNHKQPPFNSCVISNGSSNKPFGNAGGSHGQGKNAGFEKSEIDAVYFSTMTEPVDPEGNPRDSKSFGEGVIQLCDHRIFDGVNKGSYLKDGYFGSKEGSTPDEGEEIPVEFRRSKPGTDAYIIGVYESEEDILEIKQYMLRSFFVAIFTKKVVFNLFGEEFNKENLCDKIEKYFPIEKYSDLDTVWSNYRFDFNPRPYCLNSLCRPKDEINYLVRYADSSVYTFLGHATLHIWKDDIIRNVKHNDTVICMRDNGMVIDVYRTTTKKGFCGVLICDGKGANYLRLMETVTHDNWVTTQLKDAKKEDALIAKNALKDLHNFIADVTKELFLEKEGEEHSVPGLDKIMGSAGDKTQSENGGSSANQGQSDKVGLLDFTTTTTGFVPKDMGDQKEGTIVTRASGGINKRVKSKLAGQKLPTKKDASPTSNTDDCKEKEKKEKHQNTNEKKPKDISGTTQQEGEVDTNIKGYHTEVIPALFLQRSIPTDFGFIHRLRIQVFEDYDYCSMVIKMADMANGTPLKVKSVCRSEFGKDPDRLYNDDFKIEGIYGNSIRGFSLIEGYNYFDVKFDDEIDHSLMITAYENK